MAAQILVARELADMFAGRACAPGVTIQQMCRLGRTAAELVRTAGVVGRALERSQQAPVPFYGTVEEDEVDLAAVDRAWGGRAVQQPAGGTGEDGEAEKAAESPNTPKDGPVPRGMAGSPPGTSARGQGLPAMTIGESSGDGDGGGGDGGDGGDGVSGGDGGGNDTVQSPAADAEPAPAVMPMPLPADTKLWAQPRRPAHPATHPGRDAGAAPAWTTSRLGQGPGWTLEVVSPRAGGTAGAGTARGAGA
jgi:hypothetical protein